MPSPAPAGYSRTQIALHWIVAVLIGLQYVLNDPMGEAWRAFRRGAEIVADPLVAFHVFAGIAVGLLVLWRLVARFGRGVPDLPEDEHPLLKLAAHATHWTLYALMLLVPLSGAVAWFGGVEAAGEGHEVLTTILLIAVGLHVAAALFHQFVLKTDVMTRMKRPQA